jgi:hypothetical protein
MGIAPEFPVTATRYESVLSAVIERLFSDALAARVMAPTTDALHDFVGRTCLGLPLIDAPGA